MKKLLTVLLVLSVFSVACDAFNDNYGNEPKQVPGNNIPGVINAEGNVAAGDFAGDTTVCEAVATIKVVKAEESGVVTANALSIAEEGAEVTAAAEKLGAFTTKIAVTAGETVVEFVVKQIAEKEFAVCNVKYGELTVKEGEITLDRFNDGADLAKAVNAGTFKLVFEKTAAEGATAVKVIKDLASDGTETVEGTYFAEGLTEPEAAE